MQTESIDKVLEEAEELGSNIGLACSSRFSLRESSAYRLLNPNHVGKIDPCPRVLDRLEGSILPEERPVLL